MVETYLHAGLGVHGGSKPSVRTCQEDEAHLPSHKHDTLPFSENKSPEVQMLGDSFRAVAMMSNSV